MPDTTRSQQPKLLGAVRPVLRLHPSSIRTGCSEVEGIVRSVRFHGRRTRADLFPARPPLEAVLTDLAVQGDVAPSAQNQAMNALVFLDTHVLNHALQGRIDAIRADKKVNVPWS